MEILFRSKSEIGADKPFPHEPGVSQTKILYQKHDYFVRLSVSKTDILHLKTNFCHEFFISCNFRVPCPALMVLPNFQPSVNWRRVFRYRNVWFSWQAKKQTNRVNLQQQNLPSGSGVIHRFQFHVRFYGWDASKWIFHDTLFTSELKKKESLRKLKKTLHCRTIRQFSVIFRQN